VPDPVPLAVVAVQLLSRPDLTRRHVEPTPAEDRARVAVGGQHHVPSRGVEVVIDVARLDVQVLPGAHDPGRGGGEVLRVPAAHLLPAAQPLSCVEAEHLVGIVAPRCEQPEARAGDQRGPNDEGLASPQPLRWRGVVVPRLRLVAWEEAGHDPPRRSLQLEDQPLVDAHDDNFVGPNFNVEVIMCKFLIVSGWRSPWLGPIDERGNEISGPYQERQSAIDKRGHRPNENKISDGYRGRAQIEVEVF